MLYLGLEKCFAGIEKCISWHREKHYLSIKKYFIFAFKRNFRVLRISFSLDIGKCIIGALRGAFLGAKSVFFWTYIGIE